MCELQTGFPPEGIDLDFRFQKAGSECGMIEPTLIDFAFSLFILAILIGVPVVIYGLFEAWLKSRQASRHADNRYPAIKTVRRVF